MWEARNFDGDQFVVLGPPTADRKRELIAICSGDNGEKNANNIASLHSALTCAVKTLECLSSIDSVPHRAELEAAIAKGRKALGD